VRRCYGFWTNRDFSLLTEVVDPDAVLDLSRNVFNPGIHRGFDDFRRFLEQVDEMSENFQIEPEELTGTITSLRPSGCRDEEGAAGLRSRCSCSPCGRSARERCCGSRVATETELRPSKPLGCGSR
jgi:hypothetical protein